MIILGYILAVGQIVVFFSNLADDEDKDSKPKMIGNVLKASFMIWAIIQIRGSFF
jgi:hypothetical protein